MGLLKRGLVELLLIKAVIRALSRQIFIKLAKLTRRANGPVAVVHRFAAGWEFLRDMSSYNWEVVNRCRYCVTKLSADNVASAFVYGERGVIDVLRALSLVTPVELAVLREDYELDKQFGCKAEPVETVALSSERIIVASLVNVEEKVSRLQALGVENKRIILLDA